MCVCVFWLLHLSSREHGLDHYPEALASICPQGCDVQNTEQQQKADRINDYTQRMALLARIPVHYPSTGSRKIAQGKTICIPDLTHTHKASDWCSQAEGERGQWLFYFPPFPTSSSITSCHFQIFLCSYFFLLSDATEYSSVCSDMLGINVEAVVIILIWERLCMCEGFTRVNSMFLHVLTGVQREPENGAAGRCCRAAGRRASDRWVRACVCVIECVCGLSLTKNEYDWYLHKPFCV